MDPCARQTMTRSKPRPVLLSPRALLIERYGQLVGLITVKDCLKYTLAHEASSASGHASSSLAGTAGMAEDELEQTLEDLRAWVLDVKAAIQRFVLGREAGPGIGVLGRGESTEEDGDETPGSSRGSLEESEIGRLNGMHQADRRS